MSDSERRADERRTADRAEGGRTADRRGDERASLQARMAIARRDLVSLRTEKTIVLALLIQLFVAAFSSFLVVGLVSMYDPSSIDGYSADVALTGDAAEDLVLAARRADGLEGTVYPDRSGAYDAFDRHAVDAVLDAHRSDDGRLEVRVLVPDEGLRTTLLVVQLRDMLEDQERRERVQASGGNAGARVPVPGSVPTNPYFGFTYTVLIPTLVFLPVFISGSIAVDSVIEERQRGTLELLTVAPVPFATVVEVKLVALAALAPLQAALWLFLLSLNGITIAHPGWLVLLAAAIAVSVVTLGIAVSLLAPDRRQAQLLYSGAVLAVAVLASLLPEHPANTIAKLAIGAPAGTTWVLLAAYCAAGVALYVLLQSWVGRLDLESL